MRVVKESNTKTLKKFILPEGTEFKAGKYILEAGDPIYFEAPIEEDGRKDNIKNFGNKKAEPFKKDKEEKKDKKEEELEELRAKVKELEACNKKNKEEKEDEMEEAGTSGKVKNKVKESSTSLFKASKGNINWK